MIVLKILEAPGDILLIVFFVGFIATDMRDHLKEEKRRVVRTFLVFVTFVIGYGIFLAGSHLYHLFW